MISVRLLTPEEYIPPLETFGLKFLGVEVFGDVPHSVFAAPNGKRILYPGVRGYPDEIPMLPETKLDGLIEHARKQAGDPDAT